MICVITLWSYILLGLKLTKLFGIEKNPVAKDSGKVLIILYIAFIIIIIRKYRISRHGLTETFS